jgi:hypothetical protein
MVLERLSLLIEGCPNVEDRWPVRSLFLNLDWLTGLIKAIYKAYRGLICVTDVFFSFKARVS